MSSHPRTRRRSRYVVLALTFVSVLAIAYGWCHADQPQRRREAEFDARSRQGTTEAVRHVRPRTR